MPREMPTIERYDFLQEVGQGGMAVVYRAVDRNLNREVAVKVLHAHLADQEESRQRFWREAQAVAKLRHDNILEIYDYAGKESRLAYIVTEFIDGKTLKDFLQQRAIAHPEIAAMIVVELCRALAHAHETGIIHRDIKPENIMIRHDGRIKLMDFGIAQMVDVQRLTVTGQLIGSPAYMAPELVEGKPLDFRSDLFSVGTVLYQLATGDLPFSGKNPHEVLKRIAEGRFTDPELRNPVVSPGLGRIIRRALAHEPSDRYPSAAALKSELLDFLSETKIVDCRGELSAYFSDPEGYATTLQSRIVQTLTQQGRTMLTAGRTAKALQHFDRVLHTDPTNVEVLGLIEKISSRQRLIKVLIIVAVIAGIGALSYWISVRKPLNTTVRQSQKRWEQWAVGDTAADAQVTRAKAGPQDSRVGDTGRPSQMDGSVASISPPQNHRPIGAGAIQTSRRKSEHRTIKTPQAARRIEIIPTPKSVEVWLDNQRLGFYGPDLRYVDLSTTKPVTLMFRNEACCFDKTVVITPNQNIRTLDVRLPWKPARLMVRVVPPVAADILIGTLLGQAGHAMTIPIPSYAYSGRTEIQVKVSAAGFATATRQLQIRANTLSDVQVQLEKLTQ